jgi:hypothetical protein
LAMSLWPVHRADNHAAICEPIQCGFLITLHPCRPPRPVTRIASYGNVMELCPA